MRYGQHIKLDTRNSRDTSVMPHFEVEFWKEERLEYDSKKGLGQDKN